MEQSDAAHSSDDPLPRQRGIKKKIYDRVCELVATLKSVIDHERSKKPECRRLLAGYTLNRKIGRGATFVAVMEEDDEWYVEPINGRMFSVKVDVESIISALTATPPMLTLKDVERLYKAVTIQDQANKQTDPHSTATSAPS